MDTETICADAAPDDGAALERALAVVQVAGERGETCFLGQAEARALAEHMRAYAFAKATPVRTFCALGRDARGGICTMSGAYVGGSAAAAKGFGVARFLAKHSGGAVVSVECWDRPDLMPVPGVFFMDQ